MRSQNIEMPAASMPATFAWPEIDLADRHCVVTGATAGIGLATAKGLASRAAHVVLVSRDRSRGERAADEIRRVAAGGNVDLLVADLSGQKEVRALARAIRSRYQSLGLLIHNAGVVTARRTLTVDGLEQQFAVNHLAPFLLTHLLIDRLIAAAPARVVVVASQLEAQGRIAFEDLMGQHQYDPIRAYCQSKLANVLFVRELAGRLRPETVTVNALHPGVVQTHLLGAIEEIETERKDSGRGVLPRPLGRLLRLCKAGVRRVLPIAERPSGALTPEQGAVTVLYVATARELEGVSGKFVRECRVAGCSPQARDAAVARRLWQESLRLTGIPSEATVGGQKVTQNDD